MAYSWGLANPYFAKKTQQRLALANTFGELKQTSFTILLYVCIRQLSAYLFFVGRALLTELMCSKKFTASHVKVAYMKICPGEDLTTPQWDIMNVLMT